MADSIKNKNLIIIFTKFPKPDKTNNKLINKTIEAMAGVGNIKDHPAQSEDHAGLFI